MSYRNHLASVVMALLDDGDDDRNDEQNSPNQFELFSDYPTVVTFNTSEFLLENSQIIDFRIQGAPQNEDGISQSDEAIPSQENTSNNEEQDDQNQIEAVPDNPEPIIETVEQNDGNSQENVESNTKVVLPSRQAVWRRRNNRRRNPSTEEPSETLTSMSVQGLDCPYVTINDDGIYQCMKCAENLITKTFKHKYSFQRHAFLYHEGARKVFPCPQCNQEFSRPDKTIKHMKTEHNQQSSVETINKAVLFKPSNFSVEMFKMN